MKNIDIICTIGPSSWEPEVLTKMIQNGMTIARLNGAFIDIAEMRRVEKLILEISNKLDLPVKILLDIKGSELRLNKFHEEYFVNPEDQFILGSNDTHKVYPATYTNLYKDIQVGKFIKIDKGVVILQVQEIDYIQGLIVTKVIKGGIIKGGKGMNVPGTMLNNSPITNIDIEQITYALSQGWKLIAASFIRNSLDLEIIQNSIDKIFELNKIPKYEVNLISKIEDQFGIDNIVEICENCYGIMIGRGDMAAEIGYEKIPQVQEKLLKNLNNLGKYAIVATEMLESMIEDDMPSNADIADISLAIRQGASAIMLSGETTTGKFPAECVHVMKKLVEEYS